MYGFNDSKSRRTAKLHDRFKNFTNVFSKNSKNSNIGMWGVYSEAIDWNIMLRTKISFWTRISEVGSPKKTLRNGATLVGF